MDFIRTHRNIVFFVAGSFLGQSAALALCGQFVTIPVAIVTTGMFYMLSILMEDEFPEEKPVRRSVLAVAVVVAWVLLLLFGFGILRSPPDVQFLLDGKADGMPPAILASAQEVLARFPASSFVLIQATLGLVVSVVAFGGVLAAGYYLRIARLSALFTAVVCSVCALVATGLSYQSSDYPSPCALAQKTYAHAQVLDADDVSALARLGCHVSSRYSIQAGDPLDIVKDAKSK